MIYLSGLPWFSIEVVPLADVGKWPARPGGGPAAGGLFAVVLAERL